MPPEFGRDVDRLCVLELARELDASEAEPPDAAAELADAVSALRLATAGAIAAGPVVFERLDFRPLRISPLLPIAATQPRGEAIRLDALRGRLAADLRERLPLADDDRELGEALDRWELSLFADEPFRSGAGARRAHRAPRRRRRRLGGGDARPRCCSARRPPTASRCSSELRAERRRAAPRATPLRRALVEMLLHGNRADLVETLDETLLGLGRGRRPPCSPPDRPLGRRGQAATASRASTSSVCSQLRERVAQQPRDVHLRAADLAGDLRLRQSERVAEHDDAALRGGRASGSPPRAASRFSDRAKPCSSWPIDSIGSVVSPSPSRDARGSRRGSSRAAWSASITSSSSASSACASSGIVGERPSVRRQLLALLRDALAEIVDRPRNADGARPVAEVPLDLADHGRGRVRRELDAARDVEAVDRLDQADHADLDEVVEIGSPRPAYRRASERTSGRLISMSFSRDRLSPSSWYRRNRVRASTDVITGVLSLDGDGITGYNAARCRLGTAAPRRCDRVGTKAAQTRHRWAATVEDMTTAGAARGDGSGPGSPAAASPGLRADATAGAPAGCTGDERDRDAGREAAAVLERLERIGRLERDGAPAASLLGELRQLVGEAESWARLEGDRACPCRGGGARDGRPGGGGGEARDDRRPLTAKGEEHGDRPLRSCRNASPATRNVRVDGSRPSSSPPVDPPPRARQGRLPRRR